MFDRTVGGATLKRRSIVDEFTRECLVLKVDRSTTSEDVIDVLGQLFAVRGVPKRICSDNGPEFIARAIERRLKQVDVEMMYVAPGSPWGTRPRPSSRPVVLLPLRRHDGLTQPVPS